jgi:succinoglycan biosynthesis protein ExoA
MSVELPFISVVLPCRNENKAIVVAALSLLHGTYPADRFEIIIVDGMSTDGTREVLERFVAEHPGVRLIDNPERTTPYGMNAGIRAATGDLIGIFNGHSEFSPDMLDRIAAAHREHRADVVGGVSKRRPKRETEWGFAIAEATMHPFCAGDAHWRRGSDTVREADTVINACARRDVFERFGLFDTRLDRAQDRELWNRVRNKGGRILLDPKIVSWQQTRSGVGEYVAWTARGAKYLFYGALLVDHPIVGLRNFIPLAFTLYVASLLPAVLLLPWWLGLPFAAPAALYVVLALRYSLAMWRDRGDAGLALRLLLLFPLTHLSYGAGAVAGCVTGLAARLKLTA